MDEGEVKINKWIIRKFLCVFLVTVMLVWHGRATPVQANEAQNIKLQFWSNWASADLFAGQNYGIFSTTWYNEEFLQPISKPKLQSLLRATARKLDALGLHKKKGRSAPIIPDNITREAVIKSLHAILTTYEGPDPVAFDAYQAIEHWQHKGIFKGMKHELKLHPRCTVEEAVVMATRLLTERYATLEKGGKGFLWKLSHHHNTMYLFGAIPEGNTNFYPLHPTVQAAFDQSDELVVEVSDNDKAEVARFKEQCLYRDGTTLKDHVSTQTYKKAQQVFAKLKLPVKLMNRLLPWALSQTLDRSYAVQAGRANAVAVDSYLFCMAELHQKLIRQLEGLEFQGNLFSRLPADYQEKGLNQVCDQILTPGQNHRGLKRHNLLSQQWAAGDVENFKATYLEQLQADGEGVKQMLFGERDKNMADKLAQLLEQEGRVTYFVAVQAGHLALKDTIIDQLQKKGFTVQSVHDESAFFQ